jgi:hypothetical protein
MPAKPRSKWIRYLSTEPQRLRSATSGERSGVIRRGSEARRCEGWYSRRSLSRLREFRQRKTIALTMTYNEGVIFLQRRCNAPADI